MRRHLTAQDPISLHLRPIQASDASDLLQLMNSEGWIRNISNNHGVTSVSLAQAFISEKFAIGWEDRGYGYSCIRDSDGSFMGIGGFLRRDYLPHPDLGFALLPKASGRGVATRSCQILLDQTALNPSLQTVDAIALPDNHASNRVLEKLGFERIGNTNGSDKSQLLNHFRLVRT